MHVPYCWSTDWTVAAHAYDQLDQAPTELNAISKMALIESIGDPTLTVGLSFAPTYAKVESAEWSDALQWSQRVIDLADGDPAKGNFLFGSPLAIAHTNRAMARYCLGRPGWRDDLNHGLALARSADSLSFAAVVGWVYFAGIPFGVLAADDPTVREIEHALRIAERSGDDLALALARMTLGTALAHRLTAAQRDRGQKILADLKKDHICDMHRSACRPDDSAGRDASKVRLGTHVSSCPSRKRWSTAARMTGMASSRSPRRAAHAPSTPRRQVKVPQGVRDARARR